MQITNFNQSMDKHLQSTQHFLRMQLRTVTKTFYSVKGTKELVRGDALYNI